MFWRCTRGRTSYVLTSGLHELGGSGTIHTHMTAQKMAPAIEYYSVYTNFTSNNNQHPYPGFPRPQHWKGSAIRVVW